MASDGAANPAYMKFFLEVTTAKGKEDTAAAYDRWTNYEQDVQRYAPNRPFIGAKAFEAQFGSNKNIKILDAGAGSGLAAVELAKLGYNDMDALEPSESLAKQAMEKNIYKKWFNAFMCKDRLPIDDDVYDVIYSVGVFSQGQAKEDCLEELIRILKPGGKIMIVTGEGYLLYPQMANFEPRISELHDQGVLILRKRDIVPNYSADQHGPMNGVIYLIEKPRK